MLQFCTDLDNQILGSQIDGVSILNNKLKVCVLSCVKNLQYEKNSFGEKYFDFLSI